MDGDGSLEEKRIAPVNFTKQIEYAHGHQNYTAIITYHFDVSVDFTGKLNVLLSGVVEKGALRKIVRTVLQAREMGVDEKATPGVSKHQPRMWQRETSKGEKSHPTENGRG